jgi:hypothetical protein
VWGGDASDTAPGGRAGSVPGNCLDKSSVARAVSSARPQIPRGVQLQCLGRKGFQPTIARAAGAQTPTPAGCADCADHPRDIDDVRRIPVIP